MVPPCKGEGQVKKCTDDREFFRALVPKPLTPDHLKVAEGLSGPLTFSACCCKCDAIC